MPQFDISSFPSQIFWLILVFGILYFIIKNFISPRAETILISRHRIEDDHITEAEEYTRQISEIETLKKLEQADANKLIEDIRSEAIRSTNYLMAEKKSEAQKEIYLSKISAIESIEEDKKIFHQQENEFCIKAAATIIEKLTGKNVDKELLSKVQTRLSLKTNNL